MDKFLLAALAAVFLTACQPAATQPMNKVVGTERISVERIGVFEDDLAYMSRRGVYLIKDSETGQEFIGISGVGITERATHQSGKASVSDER